MFKYTFRGSSLHSKLHLSKAVTKFDRINHDFPIEESMLKQIFTTKDAKETSVFKRLMDQKIVNHDLIADHQKSRDLDQINEECRKECNMRGCRNDYCLTSFTAEKSCFSS